MKKFPLILQPKPQVYLTKKELAAISSLNGLPLIQDIHRNLFLLQCELGFRIPVKIYEIKDGYITIKDIKTGITRIIKLSPKALELLKKLNNQIPSVYLPNYNRNIRSICEKAGLNTLYTQDLGFRKKYFYKYELITSHTARQTAIINRWRTGGRISDILKFAGYRQIHLLELDFIVLGINMNIKALMRKYRSKSKDKSFRKARKLLKCINKRKISIFRK